MNKLTVNFDERAGKILPLHAVNCAPYNRSFGANQHAVQKYFTEAHIPYSRLHDCCGAYGGCYYVDIPNIFRDFDADENDEASYDFYYTDEYGKPHVVWFEDVRSIESKLRLAQRRGLSRVGYWNLMRPFAQNQALLTALFRVEKRP